MAVGEFDLIAKYFARPVRRAVLGGGDDCALLQPTPGMQWAVSTDALVEGRHFLSTVPPDALGHKSLAVNLSDLAACGARPVAFTLSLTLPRVDEAFLAGFAEGLYALADAHDIELVGGDTTAGPLNIGITVMGEVPPGQALRRGGARAGDELWVSGRLGDARLALEAFRGQAALRGEAFEDVRRAMERPQPRVALGLALRGIASAAIDLATGSSATSATCCAPAPSAPRCAWPTSRTARTSRPAPRRSAAPACWPAATTTNCCLQRPRTRTRRCVTPARAPARP